MKKPASPAKTNIEAIASLEQQALHNRTAADRVSDAITKFSGSTTFVVLHVVWFLVWVLWNTGRHAFDPFPFELLTMIVSLEAIFLSTFVLITQNRMTKQADKRAHLDLQINLLSEQEMTVVLRLLRRICSQLKIELDESEEATALLRKTDPHELMKELQKKMPD